MRFLTDENISGGVVKLLRQRGHDVLSAKESMRGQADELLLARAQTEGRILVTHDKDFGEMAFRRRLPSACGVILFRLAGAAPEQDTRRMIAVVDSRTDWEGHFAVVTDASIRIRPLPPPRP